METSKPRIATIAPKPKMIRRRLDSRRGPASSCRATAGYGGSDLRRERGLEAVVHLRRGCLRHRHISTPPSTGDCACGCEGSDAASTSPREPRPRREAKNTRPGTSSVRTRMPRSGTAPLSDETFPNAARLRTSTRAAWLGAPAPPSFFFDPGAAGAPAGLNELELAIALGVMPPDADADAVFEDPRPRVCWQSNSGSIPGPGCSEHRQAPKSDLGDGGIRLCG